MEKLLVFLCSILLVFGVVGGASATLVDFESTTLGDYTSLDFGDFTITAQDGKTWTVVGATPGPPISGNSIATFPQNNWVAFRH